RLSLRKRMGSIYCWPLRGGKYHHFLLTFPQSFYKSEESYLIYPDPTVLPRENQTQENREALEDFDVPEGHRVLSRAKGPTCTQGYAVTWEGARRLLFQIGIEPVDAPVDLEIMGHCSWGQLRCLEVNPTLFGYYRGEGPGTKMSDNEPREGVTPVENPMG